VVGGPAELPNEQDWTFLAYVDVDQTNVQMADTVQARLAKPPESGWRYEVVEERQGYRLIRSKSGRLFVVRDGQVPYLAAFSLLPPPTGMTEHEAFSDLIGLVEWAEQNS
jgi:hypothetical protein